jgi:hypothetical protein
MKLSKIFITILSLITVSFNACSENIYDSLQQTKKTNINMKIVRVSFNRRK